MKLINWLPDASSPQTPLYRAAKRFFLEVELSGVVSLTVLQAAILIAFYELGHGIFPLAYVSVGICVRYGAALSIKPQSATSANACSRSWITDEEQTRIWWALLLLDRLVLSIPWFGLLDTDSACTNKVSLVSPNPHNR